MPNTNNYKWLELQLRLHAAATLSRANRPLDNDQEGRRFLLRKETAQAGTFQNAPARSANEATLAAALFFLLFIWLWNCAKYRAKTGVSAQNRAKYFQINGEPIFSTILAETLALSAFTKTPANFPSPSPMCQMNSSLT